MITKIMVPLDGSPLAEKALPYAVALARKFAAELLVVQVLPPLVIGPNEHGANYFTPQLYEQLEQKARNYLTNLQTVLTDSGLPAATELLEGSPVAEMILEVADDRKVDLIVISTHGDSGNNRWVYGSVANKVLQGASCPVFLVRGLD